MNKACLEINCMGKNDNCPNLNFVKTAVTAHTWYIYISVTHNIFSHYSILACSCLLSASLLTQFSCQAVCKHLIPHIYLTWFCDVDRENTDQADLRISKNLVQISFCTSDVLYLCISFLIKGVYYSKRY